MNELIAFFICIPIMSAFVPIYAVQMINDRNMDRVDNIVSAAKEDARQEGYFTGDIVAEITKDIKELGFEEKDISINVTTTPKYRTDSFDERELIYFDIGVQIEQKIAANRLFGISDDENKGTYHVKGAVASEKLMK